MPPITLFEIHYTIRMALNFLRPGMGETNRPAQNRNFGQPNLDTSVIFHGGNGYECNWQIRFYPTAAMTSVTHAQNSPDCDC